MFRIYGFGFVFRIQSLGLRVQGFRLESLRLKGQSAEGVVLRDFGFWRFGRRIKVAIFHIRKGIMEKGLGLRLLGW